ncbi:MAG: tyrosine-type recombinase/integrase [Candidatus Gastranaerophilaceae bacterium]
MCTVEPIRKISDIKKIENYFFKHSIRDLLIFTIGINCGLRISDILSLDVGDVKNRNFIQIIEKKTGKFKKVPINSKLKPMLQVFTKNRAANEPLFLSVYGNRLDRIMAYRIINTACKNLNIEEHVGTHTLRKTFGYHHYKQFKDIAILQKILNHSSPQITMRYIGLEQDTIEKSYSKFIL